MYALFLVCMTKIARLRTQVYTQSSLLDGVVSEAFDVGQRVRVAVSSLCFQQAVKVCTSGQRRLSLGLQWWETWRTIITKYGSTQYIGMTQVVLHYAHTHLRFSCFTFSFNQIQLLTHQTDPYRNKEHVSKKWLKSHNRYLI